MHLPVRLVAIDVDGTLLPNVGHAITPRNARALEAAQQAGIQVVIATGRRTAFTTPLLEGIQLRADTRMITSNGAVVRTLAGELLVRNAMEPQVASALTTLLRPFGCLVFTFDRPGRPELVLENMQEAHERIALWIDANRDAIEVVRPLEDAFAAAAGPEDFPIQGMSAGSVEQMRRAEAAIQASPLAQFCTCARTEYPARDLAILDLLPVGASKGIALERLAKSLDIDRKAVMAIGDNWNDVDMLEWVGQPVLMGNASSELRARGRTLGWRQAPSNDQDGVAVTLDFAIARLAPVAVQECW